MAQATEHQYGMNDNLDLEKLGMNEVTNYLKTLDCTVHIENLQDDEMCRTVDIDILWVRRQGVRFNSSTVEIKVCTPYTTTNFFLEIISNMNKLTPGGIIYSFADYFCYLFYYRKELYILPTKDLRLWLLQNWDQHETRETKTPVGKNHYITKGKMVSESNILKIKGVEKYTLNYEINSEALKRLNDYKASKANNHPIK